MRTTIEIDDELMVRALRLTGLRSKRAVVEAGLRALVQRHGAEKLLAAFGQYPWEGEPAEQRRSWNRRC